MCVEDYYFGITRIFLSSHLPWWRGSGNALNKLSVHHFVWLCKDVCIHKNECRYPTLHNPPHVLWPCCRGDSGQGVVEVIVCGEVPDVSGAIFGPEDSKEHIDGHLFVGV